MRCVIYLRVSTKEQADRGLSIPAQRQACVRHARDQGWDLVDEYSDRGESARTADRPRLQALLSRIQHDGDIDAVVVHKIDRLARNIDDHVAIRALLRRRGVALVSITENLEETASGRLVEGIHALMAEFYSANLAAEARKGMAEKAKQGGWPHQAPIGYLNKRASMGGRRVAFIVPDPERADLVRSAFELYATGGYSVAQLTDELAERGLRGRGRRDRPVKSLVVSSVADLLANPIYTGVVEWHDATLEQWREVLETAMRFATDCGQAYRRASRKTRRLFNQAPFDLLFSTSKFEYKAVVAPTGFEPALPP